MYLNKIMSILLTTTLISQSILPAFAMECEAPVPTIQTKSLHDMKSHNDMSEEAKQQRAHVTESLRSFLSRQVESGILIQPLNWALCGEEAYTAYELLQDEPDYTFTHLPLEFLAGETQKDMDVEIGSLTGSHLDMASPYKLSKLVIGKKENTSASIFQYALFNGEAYVLVLERNDGTGSSNAGGESEDGELLNETAARESKEEIKVYAPHPGKLDYLPFIDTITIKNNAPFFHRMYLQEVKYLPAEILKKKLTENSSDKPEHTDVRWLKASDLWETVARGERVMQIDDGSVELFEPFFQTLSTRSGQAVLYKLWLDRTLKTTRVDEYFTIRDGFNQCYQVGNYWNDEEFARIQADFYLPISTSTSKTDKVLARAVAAHCMAMVQIKRRFQQIDPPKASQTALWNPTCEKIPSQIHMAMVLSDQYKEPEDFKDSPNPRRTANKENMKTFVSQNNHATYRIIQPLESDYDVWADVLDWMEVHKEWPSFVHGASDSVNNLLKTFTYQWELLGVRSLQDLIAVRGTDIYFKTDKTMWDMINRTGPVQTKETSNAMIFLNFVLMATYNTTNSTSSSIEYQTNNHSVTVQNTDARFEEAMALCGFSKPDYSYYNSLFEQFYKYNHPTAENSVMIVVSQNPTSIDKYNYPTRGGRFVNYQGEQCTSTTKFVHAIQTEFELQRQRQAKLQWEFENPNLEVEHSKVGEHTTKSRTAKPKTQARRVRFDSFNNDNVRKISATPENVRHLHSGSFLNLDLARTRAFERFPPTEAELKTYDEEMRQTTVLIDGDWLAEHTLCIPGSFEKTPVVKEIYSMAYEKVTGEKLKESLPVYGIIYLAQHSSRETVESFIWTCLETYKSNKERLPLLMVSQFIPALVKYGSVDLLKTLLTEYPEIDLNEEFTDVKKYEYLNTDYNKVPIINLLDVQTPNFTELVQFFITRGVDRIEAWQLICNDALRYKLLNELTFYPGQLGCGLQNWIKSTYLSEQSKVLSNAAALINSEYRQLSVRILGNVEELNITSYILPDREEVLINILKSNKNLKKLTIGGRDTFSNSVITLLVEGLKENATLEKLDIPEDQMTEVMSKLVACAVGPFQNAPWFKEALTAFYCSYEGIKYAVDHENWPAVTQWIKNTTMDSLDLRTNGVGYSAPRNWLPPVLEGLKNNSTLRTLTLPKSWQWTEIVVNLLSSPQGLFTTAPWYCSAWDDVLKNPNEYLTEAFYANKLPVFFTILKNSPEEIILSDCCARSRSWMPTLFEEVAQDEPYIQLNLSGSRLLSADDMISLSNALKTNTKLKSLNLYCSSSDGEKEQCLAAGLMANSTLEKLTLSQRQMISVMSFLLKDQKAPYMKAPWFAPAWESIINDPMESIDIAFHQAFRPQEIVDELIRQIVCETSVEVLDLSKLSHEHWSPLNSKGCIIPISDGMKFNTSIHTLKVNLDDFSSSENSTGLVTAVQNSKHIKHLILEGGGCEYDINQLSGILEQNNTLESLSISGEIESISELIESLCKNNNSVLKTLDLGSCTNYFGKYELETFITLLNVNPYITIIVPTTMLPKIDSSKNDAMARLFIKR